jgi:hypothetical protein
MPTRYLVARINGELELKGDPAGEPWSGLDALKIACFPWYRAGSKQGTTVKACYSHACLYLLFVCEDRHISARRTVLNSDVYRDSCVELFASVPEDPGCYFNLEMNCCGAILLGYGPDRGHRRPASQEIASRIRIHHSVPGPTNESPDDKGWLLEVALPFDVVGELAGRPVTVRPGTRWRANLYRCGGATDRQHACWSPIPTPEPDFHRPEYFGLLEFAP